MKVTVNVRRSSMSTLIIVVVRTMNRFYIVIERSYQHNVIMAGEMIIHVSIMTQIRLPPHYLSQKNIVKEKTFAVTESLPSLGVHTPNIL